MPALGWSSSYRLDWLKWDLVSGITLAAYAIPVSMAYASLAGLPPQTGVYCYLLAGFGYAALGSCRQLAVGPTSALALLVGGGLAGLAEAGSVRWAQIAALTAATTAGFCFLAWLLRLSRLVGFISETVLVGFKAGAALTIGLTQLPKLFGVPGGGDNFFERAWMLAGQLGDTNGTVLVLGLAALGLLLVGDRLLPGRPVALIVVVLAIVVVSTTAVKEAGVSTVGALPAGLPEWTAPSLRLRDVDAVLPLACACFLLAYIESVSAARSLGAKNGYPIDPRQELLALGTANLAVAFGQGFPVAGGLSQSAVNDKAGARTPLALVIASLALAFCLLYLTGLVSNLPNVVLAAIVLVAVMNLIDLKALRRLHRVSRMEFRIALTALVAVLLLGILKGVLAAAVISLLVLLAGTSRPHVAILGRVPGTRRYSDVERHPENEAPAGVLIFRPESSLLYFNCEHVQRVVWEKVLAAPRLGLVVGDLSDAPTVDVAASGMLKSLHEDLVKRGTALRLVEAHAGVRDLLRADGLEERVGTFDRRVSLDQVVAEFEEKGTHARVEREEIP